MTNKKMAGSRSTANSKTRRTALKTIGALGITSLGFSGSALGDEGVITADYARRVAEAKVTRLSDGATADWEPQNIGAVELFNLPVEDDSGVSFEPIVYSFQVEKGSEQLGYITVSARTALPPILGYGTQPAAQYRLSSQSGSDHLSGLNITSNFLFLGAMSYGVQAIDPRATGGTQHKYVDLRNGRVAPLPVRESIHSFSVSSQASQNQWDALKSSSPEEYFQPQFSTMRTADTEVSGVTNWSHSDNDDSWAKWDGCSPIAASMAIGHHENTGSGGKDELIDTLHKRMSTRDTSLGDGLTLPGDIPRGIRNYDKGNYDYSSPQNNTSGIGLTRKQQTKNQIGDGNPLLLSTMEWDVDLVGHTECVVGYDVDDKFYYKCYDTYGGVNWIANQSWATGFTTPVIPK